MDNNYRINQYIQLMPLGEKLPIMDAVKLGFFTAPASTKRHGAYKGGLYDHSYQVTKYLLELTEKLGLTWEKERSPYIVGMYHDLCKCGLYTPKEDEIGYEYNSELIIPGHGDRSVIMLQKYIDLTDEEIACIRWHMGAYETDTRLWNCYGAAVTKYPNVLFTHTADMYASKVIGV